MARASALSTVLGFVVVYEVAAFAANWFAQQQGGSTVLPFDLIGSLFGYPGLPALQPVQVTAQSVGNQYTAEGAQYGTDYGTQSAAEGGTYGSDFTSSGQPVDTEGD